MKKLTRRESKAFTKYCYQSMLLGEGSGRKVYKFQHWVIKIAKNKLGRLQNKNEVERYSQYKHTNKLATILAYHKNKVVIMERVKPLYEDEPVYEYNELANWFNDTFNICSEDNMSQGEARDGTVKIYDYGYQNSMWKYFSKDYSIRERIFGKDEI